MKKLNKLLDFPRLLITEEGSEDTWELSKYVPVFSGGPNLNQCFQVSPAAPTTNRKTFKQATLKRKNAVIGPKLQGVKRAKPMPTQATPPKLVKKTVRKVVEVAQSSPKPIAHQPSPEDLGGDYELNTLMSRMLEKELEDIMIKIWQELPDEPSDKAEKVVVEKFRNEAGDDLRNVLGLNVTKRILNVYNPLYVKVHFTKRPERDHLKAFLLKYRCIKFERVDAAAKTFSALMKNIQDFDKICSVKSIRIGNLKVYINPNYDFLKCPSNLKTIFDDSRDDVNMKTDMKLNITNQYDKDNNINSVPIVNEKENVEMKADVKSEAKTFPEVKEKVMQPQKPTETKTVAITVVKPATVNKPNENKSLETAKPVNVPVNETPKKITVTKPEPKAVKDITKPASQKAITKEETNTKPNIPINKTPVKIQETKPVLPEVKSIANEKSKIATPTAAKIEVKLTKTKVIPSNKVEEIKVTKPQETQKKTIEKPIASQKKAVQNKPKVNSVQKNIAKGKIKTKSQTMRILREGDDYDVLDDDDILALISEGVILDECSGSDSN